MDSATRNLRQDISAVVNDCVTNKLEKYEQVANNFKKFFNEDELMRIVKNKVDYETLEKMTHNKASRKEFDASVEITTNLFNRLKHLSMLVVEVARVMVPGKSSSSLKATETINTKIQRRNYLL